MFRLDPVWPEPVVPEFRPCARHSSIEGTDIENLPSMFP